VGEQGLVAEDLDRGVGRRDTAGQDEQQASGRAADRDVGLSVPGRHGDAGRCAGDEPLPRACSVQAGIGGVEVQGLAVAAQVPRPGRVGGAGHDEAEPFVDPVGGEAGGQADAQLAAGRELGVGQMHGGLVRAAARPPPGRARPGERPHRVVADGRDGFGDQVGAFGQPGNTAGGVVGHTPVRYISGGDGRGGAGGYDLGRPPVTAADVRGELPEGPARAGRDRPFQVAVDDLGQLGRAGAQFGEETFVVTHRRPPRAGLRLA
jgi:hypothetical protein